MLKSDQQEKVPTTTPARSTAETILRRIPNNVNKEQQIHLRNLMDLNKQWSISDTTKLREKPNHKSLPSYTSKKSDKAQPHHMSIWVHIRDTRRCLSNKRLTASNTHLKTKTRHEPNTGVLPWIRLHILSGIGGYAKSSLQGFSVDKSHVAEMANHNKVIIASIETGVDIRLASTSTTNPHCKGQIILRPDTMILRKLSTHAPQVVHEEIRCCLSNKRLTASHTKFLQN
jgi:hypothetical protein